MIAGGATAVAGGLLYLGDVSTHRDTKHSSDGGVFPIVLGAIGYNLALDGAVVFLFGKAGFEEKSRLNYNQAEDFDQIIFEFWRI